MTIPSDRDPKPPLPVVRNEPMLPRAALERVLARATELQGDGTSEASDAISESRLMEIAREVGIDTAKLRQALAEERARLPMQEPEQGVVLDALGPPRLSAQRIVPGTPAEVLAKLDAWMPRMEALAVRRRVADRVSWEPRHDKLGNFLRSLGHGRTAARPRAARPGCGECDACRRIAQRGAIRCGGVCDAADAAHDHHRDRARTVRRGLPAVGAHRALRRQSRSRRRRNGGVAALVGGMGWLSWRSIRRAYREMLDRTQLRLEQLLDELESGGMQPPPSLARQVTAALLR